MERKTKTVEMEVNDLRAVHLWIGGAEAAFDEEAAFLFITRQCNPRLAADRRYGAVPAELHQAKGPTDGLASAIALYKETYPECSVVLQTSGLPNLGPHSGFVLAHYIVVADPKARTIAVPADDVVLELEPSPEPQASGSPVAPEGRASVLRTEDLPPPPPTHLVTTKEEAPAFLEGFTEEERREV